MTKTYKICLFLAISFFIMTGICSLKFTRRAQGYRQVALDQSRQQVNELMGTPSEIKPCQYYVDDREYYPDGDCFELYGYNSFLQYRAVAFDRDGKVIKKFHWDFTDGYGKPHEFDW